MSVTPEVPDNKKNCAICGEFLANGQKTFILTWRGSNAVNAFSLRRSSPIKVKPGDELHEHCRKWFTNERQLKQTQTKSTQVTTEKRQVRSKTPTFDFKTYCLFCGKPLKNDVKRTSVESAISSVTNVELKESILDVCRRRNDDWATEVQLSAQNVIDLVAA